MDAPGILNWHGLHLLVLRLFAVGFILVYNDSWFVFVVMLAFRGVIDAGLRFLSVVSVESGIKTGADPEMGVA